jgi:spermidine/putrescine ABC transporter ATP-binding subunit
VSVIELQDIRLSYGSIPVLKGVTLRLASSEFAAVLGPSGCGKTSLLRVIAGFSPYAGSLKIDGQDMAKVPPHRRNIGIVFQDYALFPHRTIAENVGYGLKMRSAPREHIRKRVGELLELLGLSALGDRYPHSLSGGQKQRVAIARALAIEPKMLLLDEPLSALDRKFREEMQVELRQIQKRVGITTLFVTHDQEEAMALADRIVLMSEGTIRQIGTPTEVYLRPSDSFVAEFIGQSNFFTGAVTGRQDSQLRLRLRHGHDVVVALQQGADPAGEVLFSVRPERIRLLRHRHDPSEPTGIAGTVSHVIFKGAYWHIGVATAGGQTIKVYSPDPYREGEDVTIGWSPDDAVILPRRGAR